MNSSLIGNAAKFPQTVLASFEACPMRLRDESKDTLIKLCKIMAHEGLRARVLTLVNTLDSGRKAEILRAIRPTRSFN